VDGLDDLPLELPELELDPELREGDGATGSGREGAGWGESVVGAGCGCCADELLLLAAIGAERTCPRAVPAIGHANAAHTKTPQLPFHGRRHIRRDGFIFRLLPERPYPPL
jgi:hypothetical protein